MRHLKARLFALVLILVFGGLIALNWYELMTQGRYYMKLAAFGPLGVIGGFFLLLFPARAGKPDTTRDKIIALFVFVIGLAAGLANWFLMDPAFFGR